MPPPTSSTLQTSRSLQTPKSTKDRAAPASSDPHPSTNERARESFDDIYLDLSREAGKCRFAETGFGWKPAGGGDTFTLDASNIGGAQWSRAAKGFEVKILQRNSGIVQLDGFKQEVCRMERDVTR